MKDKKQHEDEGTDIGRRGFLKGAGVLGAAAVVGTALAGCGGKPRSEAPKEGSYTGDVPSSDDPVTQRLIDRGIVGAGLPNAKPIPPAEVPASWDDETDVIVVGMGGGGLMAADMLAEKGLKVIGVEKESTVGGASRHAASVVDVLGGTKEQTKAGFPGMFGGDKQQAIRVAEMTSNYTVNRELLNTLLDNHVEAMEYFLNTDGVNYTCGKGPFPVVFQDIDVVTKKQNHVLGLNNAINALERAAKKHGADIRTNTEVIQLVYDGQRVQGVLVQGLDGAKKYLKARKGVILSSGGFGMNKDLIKAYLPSVVEGAVQGGPMPCHTGEAFRMGLGLGADFAGYDSWCCWEAGIDESTAGGDGNFWHYFWHGERQLFHNPWLLIDRNGNRQEYFAYNQPTFQKTQNPNASMGDLVTTTSWMAAPGHKVYNICDSKFPKEVFKKNTTMLQNPLNGDECRTPITNPKVLLPNGGLVTADWLKEVDDAVKRGAVKKADTLDELAEQLKLDPDVLKKAVKEYNELCDKGKDKELPFPYDKTWLSKIDKPPYYAAIIGGQIGKTLCGLRVNGNLQVMKEDGTTVDGLYATYSTFGGMDGEGNYGCFWNGGTFFGGIGSSLITGYIAGKMLAENEK